MRVTFLGHSDTPHNIEPILKKVIENLILNNQADLFYVGTHGNFDAMAKKCLIKLNKIYPYIKYLSVLAYMPNNNDRYTNYSNTIYPDCIENVPPKFAISKRNKWMIEHSETVICYVKHTFSNAAQFLDFGKRKNKTIINLAE